ncbi:hypothetical protein THRCLA_11444 [Thraustotheca clavata]|uniref:Macro domain-containing protein n=1 Tax=Thraustotheca clavata TaxID=74557 RepID=A0A1V9Y7Q1_9STRA|nr:hypothetical protein THRCLA_11444 [Thraustotheca clavata]
MSNKVFAITSKCSLVVSMGDITLWKGDAIVNAANERMLGGGGVDGAIHNAAGPQLLEACYQVPEVGPRVRCPVGEARITDGFKLTSKHVIHAVGPIYSRNDSKCSELLEAAYMNSLRVGAEHGCTSIAFPAISCGIFRYPLIPAATIAVSSCIAFAKSSENTVKMLGRDGQIAQLVALMGGEADVRAMESSEPMSSVGYPVIVVYGYNSTGKSSSVLAALNTMKESNHATYTAFVDCTTIYNARQVFTDILRQIDPLARSQPDDVLAPFPTQSNGDGYHNLNLLGFVQCLCKIMMGLHTMNVPNVVIVLDNVDLLIARGFSDLLRSLCRLNDELSIKLRFSLVLITRGISLQLEKLLLPFVPTHVHFPLYTQEEISDILVDQLKLWEHERLFRAWVKYLHQLFEHDCHDWIEFRYMIIQLLPLFYQHCPEDGGYDPTSDQYKASYKQLVHQTQLRAKSLLQHLYHRNTTIESQAESASEERVHLPFGCLMLVLASYLSSFNPQESDAVYFSTAHIAKKRRKGGSSGAPKKMTKKQAEAVPQHLLGPKVFPLQRLLAIYSSILEEYDPPATLGLEADDLSTTLSRSEVFNHINVLTRMCLLQRISNLEDLDDIKLRCLADHEFIERISRQIEFPLENFLNQMA